MTKMSFNQESAVKRATEDLAERLDVAADKIEKVSVTATDFPNMSLGAATEGEMSAQMIATGWKIILRAAGEDYEYRADRDQLRLFGFKGKNYLIES